MIFRRFPPARPRAQAGWFFLLMPVPAGALALVLMGIAYRRFMAGLRSGGEA